MFIKKGLFKKKGFFIKKGLFIGRGLISKIVEGFSGYYQWLPLGEDDNLTNKGTGGTPAVDGNYISGSMLGQDLVFRQPAGDTGLYALSEQ